MSVYTHTHTLMYVCLYISLLQLLAVTQMVKGFDTQYYTHTRLKYVKEETVLIQKIKLTIPCCHLVSIIKHSSYLVLPLLFKLVTNS